MSSRLFAFLWKMNRRVQRRKNGFVGENCVTAKDKGSCSMREETQGGAMIFRRASQTWKTLIKEKEYLRAPQGKGNYNMNYVIFYLKIVISWLAKKVICLYNYVPLQELHEHKISTVQEVWRKDWIKHCVLLGSASPDLDSNCVKSWDFLLRTYCWASGQNGGTVSCQDHRECKSTYTHNTEMYPYQVTEHSSGEPSHLMTITSGKAPWESMILCCLQRQRRW